MPYLAIESFSGMDRRRKRVAGVPGSLWTLKNAHLTRGGDIERSKRFDTAYTLPAGSFSLAGLRSQLFTFGSADLAGTTPLGVQYQRLQAPDTPNMTRVLDAKPFQGKLYVIAEYDDGNVYHFYDGTRVSDWDNVVIPTADDVAERLAAKLNRSSAVRARAFGNTVEITARTPGTAFTISGSATDGGGGVDTTETLTVTQLQANVAGVAETRATAVFEITAGTNDPGTDTINSVTVDGVELLSEVIDWSGSNAATAIRVAASVNNGTSIHGYTASVAGAEVTLTAAPGTGDAPNGDSLVVTTTGSVTATQDATVAGGVDAVAAVAQVEKAVITGVIEIEDTFLVTVDTVEYKVTGLAAGMGTSVYVDQQRVWSTAGRLWRYCMLGNATVWDPNNATPDNDAGFLDLMETTETTDAAVAATRYQSLAAVFSQNFIALYALDVDPTNIAVADTLDNTGTDAPKSIVRYGNNDVFYLDTTGIRSLRARDASNAPFVFDVGNAIDTFVQEVLATLTQEQAVDAIAAIEPRDGRYWLAAGGYIFVLSFFPADKISAWSYYQPDEFEEKSVSALVRVAKQMYVRAGDKVFLYGGVDGESYPEEDESEVTVDFPFLSAGAMASFKEWTGFDIACTNEWEIVVLYDPNDENRSVELGRITKTTFNEMHSNLNGHTSMVAPKLSCRRAGRATVSSMALHYSKVG